MDAEAVAVWLPPDGMRGVIHAFDAQEGGAFSMSLIYLDDAASPKGKTVADTDMFEGRFMDLIPDRQVTWATVFTSEDPSFAGEMTVRTTLVPISAGTEVTITCENIPSGINLEDNEAGCRESLAKLAAYVRDSAN